MFTVPATKQNIELIVNGFPSSLIVEIIDSAEANPPAPATEWELDAEILSDDRIGEYTVNRVYSEPLPRGLHQSEGRTFNVELTDSAGDRFLYQMYGPEQHTQWVNSQVYHLRSDGSRGHLLAPLSDINHPQCGLVMRTLDPVAAWFIALATRTPVHHSVAGSWQDDLLLERGYSPYYSDPQTNRALYRVTYQPSRAVVES